MVQEYRSNRNVVFACHYHVVWCPKYRRKLLVGPIEKRLKEIVMQACSEHQAEVEELEVMPDHVHVLVNVDPQFGIHRLMKLIKGRSSRFLRQEYPELKRKLPTLWTHYRSRPQWQQKYFRRRFKRCGTTQPCSRSPWLVAMESRHVPI